MIRRFTILKSPKFKTTSSFFAVRPFTTTELDQIREKVDSARTIMETRAYPKVQQVADNLEKLSYNQMTLGEPEMQYQHWLYFYDKMKEVKELLDTNKIDNEDEKIKREQYQKIMEELKLRNIDELKKKCDYFYEQKTKTLNHQQQMREKYNELGIWMKLNEEFSIQNSSFDEKIIELTQQKIEIDNKLEKEYEKRKKFLLANVSWGL
jgi:hypothetical protein